MNANFSKKIFYPPNYLFLPATGIEICNRSIKYVEFFNKSGDFSIKKFGEVSLLPNIIKDGDILNKKALIDALSKVKKSISSDFVTISIPEEKTYIFDVELPKAAKDNLREALEFKIEENVPLKLDESSFEYEVVENIKTSQNIIVSVSVIPKKIISDYTEVLEQSDIHPTSFEIESRMIANSVISKGNKGTFIIVNIKDDSTIFIAVINGFVRFTTSTSIGESAIRETLLKTGLFSDELVVGKFFENDFSFETTYTKESYASLVNIFSILKDEVEKFNEYIVNKFPSVTKNAEKVILCGRSSVLPGLAKHINQNLKTEVSLADAWSNVFESKGRTNNMKFNDSLSFVTPIGLVISSYK
jgi:type IV pilus assembly protein PilM